MIKSHLRAFENILLVAIFGRMTSFTQMSATRPQYLRMCSRTWAVLAIEPPME